MNPLRGSGRFDEGEEQPPTRVEHNAGLAYIARKRAALTSRPAARGTK